MSRIHRFVPFACMAFGAAAVALVIAGGLAGAADDKGDAKPAPAAAKSGETPKAAAGASDSSATQPAAKTKGKVRRGKGKSRQAAAAPQLKQAQLLLELPDSCNTPDGMALLPDGNIILSVPNFNDKKAPPLLMKITKDNKLEEFYKLPGNPDTGRAGPMGICVAPSGDLYLADNQIFHDPNGKPMLYGKSRLVRIVVKDGKATDMVEVVYGFNVSNAVVVHEGCVYVTETILEPDSKPLVSGVFRFKLGEEKVKLTSPLKNDPHLIATIKTYNEKIPFGADGATFDDKGNLYIGNFADGTMHKLVFDKQGKVTSNEIFAKASFMRSCDGIFYDRRTNKIYVADSMANAVQMVSMDGTVQTLAQDPDNDGSGGRLDQPCEVVVRGSEVIVSNMDFPVPGGVNTKFDKPYTMSFIKLD